MSEDQDIVKINDEISIQKADEKIKTKLGTLAAYFKSRFHRTPAFFVQVPGRVNLIGEHVDYCGYSVCPMAIEQHMLVAVCKTDEDVIQLTNVDDKYEDYCHDGFRRIRDSRLDEHSLGPTWYKYFLCGVKGALEVVPEPKAPKGILAAVWGNVPPNAGLSSSSALVSAALLATVHASQHKMSKEDMATLSAKAERYIGTQGGGMDQAIAFLGKAGSAKHIEFNPLRSHDVMLPKDAVFVIANSLADHNKASTSDYNQRVLECRLAAKVLAKKRNADWQSVNKLIDVQKLLNKSLKEMADIVMTDLHNEPYSMTEIEQILGTESELLIKASNSAYNYQKLKLKQRALHVFQEADRVTAFRQTCERTDLEGPERLVQLGKLMSASHVSLRSLYECSHPRIDALVQDAMSCGALGARLTGAGWGGCIVAITTADRVEEFLVLLKKKFYENNEEAKMLDLSTLLFKTEPKQGAVIYYSELPV
ncbi:N-acetylgalactosamine kinase [Trichogramma pretiosum]|uniref:N-acetylgalactosamine kinase n=1 Tax=Trichogramma pretiosum TaxID=7493 RepID=UPI0006C9B9E8|nr:N-acetylgalactosamine kinase [Trichogramma pretiosum]